MFSSEKGKRLARMTNVISQRYWPSLAGSQRGLDGNLSQTALMGNFYLYLHFYFLSLFLLLFVFVSFFVLIFVFVLLFVSSFVLVFVFIFVFATGLKLLKWDISCLICNQNFWIKNSNIMQYWLFRPFKMSNYVSFGVLLIKQSIQWGKVYSPHGDIHRNILNFLQSPYRNNPESHEISHWIYIT